MRGEWRPPEGLRGAREEEDKGGEPKIWAQETCSWGGLRVEQSRGTRREASPKAEPA